MAWGFAIPHYVLIMLTYGWWVWNFIVFDDIFDDFRAMMALWFFAILWLHMHSIRTIHTRVGYDEKTFYPENKVALGFSYGFLLPIIFFDSKSGRGFVYYLARAWENYWIVLYIIKGLILALAYFPLSFYIEGKDDEAIRAVGHTYSGISITVLMCMIYPWFFKTFVCLFYIIPWILYTIGWILLFPFEKWCACVKRCRDKYKSKRVEESYSYSYSEEYDGGSDEEEEQKKPNYDNEDDEDTKRNLEINDIMSQPRK